LLAAQVPGCGCISAGETTGEKDSPAISEREQPSKSEQETVEQKKETDVDGPDFQKNPLIAVIAQDAATGEVLMLAYMNEEAYRETLSTKRVCYYSRSRKKLWRKGEESGNVQELKEIYFDCDADALLVKVNQIGGAACHEGYKSCFFRRITSGGEAFEVVGDRVFDPAQVYGKK
jgi:phosphoribosyl-AMP cyclohydrolase